jgi:hypothetical protein
MEIIMKSFCCLFSCVGLFICGCSKRADGPDAVGTEDPAPLAAVSGPEPLRKIHSPPATALNRPELVELMTRATRDDVRVLVSSLLPSTQSASTFDAELLNLLPPGQVRKEVLQRLVKACPNSSRKVLIQTILSSGFPEDAESVRLGMSTKPYMSSADAMDIYCKVLLPLAKSDGFAKDLILGIAADHYLATANLSDALAASTKEYPLVAELSSSIFETASITAPESVLQFMDRHPLFSIEKRLATNLGQHCFYQDSERLRPELMRVAKTTNNPAMINGYVSAWLQTNTVAASEYVKLITDAEQADQGKLAIVEYLYHKQDKVTAQIWNDSISGPELRNIYANRFK